MNAPLQALACVVLAGLTALSAVTAGAADADTERVERERITAERAALRARFAEQERDCAERFAATACVDDARRTLREGLTRLRRQESSIEAAQRKQRAAQRMQVIRERVAAEETRQREASALAASAAPRTSRLRIAAPRELDMQDPPGAGVAPIPDAASAARSAASAPGPRQATVAPRGAASAPGSADAATRRTAYAERQRAALAHRETVEKRLAERAAAGKPGAAPLPPAPDASAP